jgi:hypothetical protein
MQVGGNAPRPDDDIYNIFVDNVLTRGRTAVTIQGPLKNAVLHNIVGTGGCTNLVEKTAPTENVIIDAKQF